MESKFSPVYTDKILLIQRNILHHQQFLESYTKHPNPFISDDVCCYSPPSFDEVAKLFHKLGEGGCPDQPDLGLNCCEI